MILKSKGVVRTYDIGINDFSVNVSISTDLQDGTRVSHKIKQDTFDGFADFLKIVKPYEGEEI